MPSLSLGLQELVQAQADHPEFNLLQYRSAAAAHQYQGLHDLVSRFVPEKARVLDWGCGNGHFAYALIKMGLKVSAYSFDDLPPVLQQFPPAGLEFVKGSPADPVTLPFADRTFDAVFSVGVLEHVGDYGGREASSLAEIGRVLKEQGVFVAYHLPNALSWVEFFARRFPGMHSHRRLYTRSEIPSIGRRARLEMLEVKRYGFMPRWFLNRLPRRVIGSPAFQAAYLGLDRALTLALNPWCTNYYFVARKVNAPKP